MYILGIDYGTKKLGIALLESTTGIVSPLPVLKNDQYLQKNIAKIIADYRITVIILGLPSYENTQKKVAAFAQTLEIHYKVAIHYTNEDNTSLVIKKQLETKKQKSQLDSMSASEILTQWHTDQERRNLISS